MDSLGLQMIPLHISEWNSSSGPKDTRHDTYQNAAFVLHVLRHTEEASSMSYWTFTDIFEEPGPQVTPFHGGFGLINLQNIKKPTYYAYQFLSELGDKELKNTDSESYICKDKIGNLQVLFWDFATNPDQTYASKFFDDGNKPQHTNGISIDVINLPKGKYSLKIFRTGYHVNDPLSAYNEMGAPYNINREQEKKLKELSANIPVNNSVINITDGRFKFKVLLESKDVYLIKLNRL